MEDAEKLVLIGSMMVGGEVGSTAGGLKILRLLLILRLLQLALSRVSLPRSARLPTRFGDDILGERQIETLLAILVGYLVTILVAWFLFLLHGHDALDALFDVVSAVCTVGLSTGVTAPDLEPLLKMVLTVIMLMGRLETVAFVVLFFPGTWIGRRRPAR
jgi:trk system potassium uptake protein TrkH